MSKSHYIFLLIIVLVIATLTYKLSTNVEDTFSPLDPSLRHDPDYFISDFITTMYDAEGIANYYLKGKYMEHFPDDDTFEIDALEIKYNDQNNQSWITTSNKGLGLKNIEVLHLSGNVKIENQPVDPDKKLILLTDKLRIDFKTRQATTDAMVKISGKSSTINAIGMKIDLNKGIVKLKSQARGQYVPN
ncbi:hypothetical protein MNBD_GAMMA21-2525 [hydrothermal vent metagenome]|uniref:Lipopolysaccharide export system protein LptC n=1 Tax=hydrothermal vent metagenome TaxID=652676 RepID=A0A3B0ZV83_9ZZZZ